MGEQKQVKLNWLQTHLPEGLLADAGWLQRHGFSSSLRSKYVAHDWLDQVVRGVYRRPPASLPVPFENEDERVHWQHVVVSLQTLLERALAVGGRTALELQGLGHYLSAAGSREIHLYGTEQPPGWVSKLKLEARFVFHNSGRLFKDQGTLRDLRTQRDNLPTGPNTGSHAGGNFIRQPWGRWEWPLTMSSPERAILELLDEIPQRETFHQADVLMEGLRNLSPRRLDSLLMDCRSVKVKRLFLWFAERHNHAWLKGLNRKDIDLGSGKRMLVRGGKLDAKFNITVPENLDAHG